jgi:uncharacterized surface protein with fasciclin (FAS1) repeats
MIKKMMAGVLLAALAVTAIAPATVSAKGSSLNIVEKAVAVNEKTGLFDTVLTAATECGPDVTDPVVSLLTGNGTADAGITFFAPTDRAFRILGRDLGLGWRGLNPHNVCKVDHLLGEGTLLRILAFHVFEDAAVDFRTAKSLRGQSIDMAVFDDPAKLTGKRWRVFIDGSRVIIPNVKASNGIIHVVNRVLNPLS